MNPMQIESEIMALKKDLRIERERTNSLVQVLLHNLPESALSTKVNFTGTDCHNNFVYSLYSYWDWSDDRITLREFLSRIIDP